MEQYFFEEEKNLSASETNIMKAIWDAKEDISVPDLMEQMKIKYGKEYARTTVATFLLKLSGKGFVRSYRKGKLSYARAIRSEEEYKKKLMVEEAEFWFEGKITDVMSALCSEKKLTKEEVDEIRSILDDITISDN